MAARKRKSTRQKIGKAPVEARKGGGGYSSHKTGKRGFYKTGDPALDPRERRSSKTKKGRTLAKKKR